MVEAAGVGGAVGADQAGTVQGEQDVEVLDGDVVYQLVVAPLQEGGVDGDDGLHALAGLACGQGDGMLFGNGDIEVAFWVLLGKLDQARTLAHGGGDAQEAVVLPGHVAQPVAEDFGVSRVGRGLALGQSVLGRVEGGHAVVGQGVLFRRGVALALFGDDVQETWALDVLEALQGLDQHVHVVAVDGADVVEAKLFEQRAGDDHAFDMLFGAPRQFPDAGHPAQDFFAFFAHGRVEPAGQDLGEVVVHRPDVGRDAHVVVVQYDQQVRVDGAGVVHGLVGHAAGDAAVADDGDHVVAAALELVGDGHPQGRADTGAGVAYAEGVVLAFLPVGEGAHAALGADAGHPVLAPGQDLVGVSLMPHVPDQLVARRVEHVVQGDGQLHRPQPRREMPPRYAHRLRQVLAQLLA